MCVFPVRTIPLKFDMLNGLSKVLVLAVVLPWNPADMQLCFYVSKVCRLWSNGENPASHSVLQTGIVRWNHAFFQEKQEVPRGSGWFLMGIVASACRCQVIGSLATWTCEKRRMMADGCNSWLVVWNIFCFSIHIIYNYNWLHTSSTAQGGGGSFKIGNL